MASKTFRYISALLLSLAVSIADAQTPADTTAVEPSDSIVTVGDLVNSIADKVKGKHEKKIHFINGAAVGADIVGWGMKALGSDWRHMEVLGRINILDRYFPIAELGIGEANHEGRDLENRFKVRAPYFRVGADYNFIKDKTSGNRIFGGLRYGFTPFKYDVSGPALYDSVYKTYHDFNHKGLSANSHWVELVGGIEAKVWGILHLGWSVRYKMRIAESNTAVGHAWYVPGYGTSGGSVMTGTFNVSIDI